MKIYCQCGNSKVIQPKAGDTITEINFMKALSLFADVYYSGNRFINNGKTFGMKNYPQSLDRKMLSSNYDIYYIRNNPDLFKKIPKGKKKIYFSTPYSKFCFDRANIIATTTETWAKKLRDGDIINNLNPKGFKFPKSTSINQTVDVVNVKEKWINKMRQSFNSDFTIGILGRVVTSCYPATLLSILPQIKEECPNFKIVWAITKSKMNLPKNDSDIIYRSFSYNQMPIFYNACDCIVESYSGGCWDYVGSMKSIEAAAYGTPIIMAHSSARSELFQDDYKLFVDRKVFKDPTSLESQKCLLDLILKLYNDELFRKDISLKIQSLSKKYCLEESSKYLKQLLQGI